MITDDLTKSLQHLHISSPTGAPLHSSFVLGRQVSQKEHAEMPVHFDRVTSVLRTCNGFSTAVCLSAAVRAGPVS